MEAAGIQPNVWYRQRWNKGMDRNNGSNGGGVGNCSVNVFNATNNR